MRIQIQSGDISTVKADAIITAINPAGVWSGGIDRVIQRAAGDVFHDQARCLMPLRDGQTIVTRRPVMHNAPFNNVVFVVDDLQQPLRIIIKAGLKAASNAGFKMVTLPMIRMGVMLGVVEKTRKEAVSELVLGVRAFLDQHPDTCIESATFVVYRDPETEQCLFGAFPDVTLIRW